MSVVTGLLGRPRPYIEGTTVCTRLVQQLIDVTGKLECMHVGRASYACSACNALHARNTQCTRTFVCAWNTNTIAVYRIYQGTLTEAEGSVQFTSLR